MVVPNPSHPTQIPHLRLLVPLGSIQEVPEAICDAGPWIEGQEPMGQCDIQQADHWVELLPCFFGVHLHGWHSWLVTHFCHSFSDHVQRI